MIDYAKTGIMCINEFETAGENLPSPGKCGISGIHCKNESNLFLKTSIEQFVTLRMSLGRVLNNLGANTENEELRWLISLALQCLFVTVGWTQ